MTAAKNKDIKQQRIMVLMGGSSNEREISLRSGQAVFEALQGEGLDVVALDLSKDTRLWFQQIQACEANVAFIALHGTYGEDGCIQAVLETLHIPYTGSGVMASALCMDKKITKALLHDVGISTPRDVVLQAGAPQSYPVFVKPNAEGSSVGLHYVADEAAWLALVMEEPKIQEPKSWLIETCIQGVEVHVSVLNGKALPAVEVVPKSGMYDYASKYTAGATDYYCPARLSDKQTESCQRIAERAVAVLNCAGAPRVDLMVPEHGEPVVLEVNTIPGMTTTSLLPKAAMQVGMTFPALCLAILEAALAGGE